MKGCVDVLAQIPDRWWAVTGLCQNQVKDWVTERDVVCLSRSEKRSQCISLQQEASASSEVKWISTEIQSAKRLQETI